MDNTWQISQQLNVGHRKLVFYPADEGLRAEKSCIQLLINLLRNAHKLLTYNAIAIQSRSL